MRAVELDSWFYRHETSRPIDEIGYPHDVPPSGAWEWKPRTTRSLLRPAGPGADAIERFADGSIGRRSCSMPATSRRRRPMSTRATWWVDLLAAHPHDPAYFRRWFDDARALGRHCIEQDWMLIYWFGVRALRSAPGRAAAWQRALNAHGTATDVDLLWCMATPADLIAAVSSIE